MNIRACQLKLAACRHVDRYAAACQMLEDLPENRLGTSPAEPQIMAPGSRASCPTGGQLDGLLVTTGGQLSWRAQLARCAALPNTVAKVSGLRLPGVPYTAAALRHAWDAALDIFGPGRLMYGGDWPVSILGGNYADPLAVLQELIGTLDPTDALNIWSGTARRTYGHAIWDEGETAQSGP